MESFGDYISNFRYYFFSFCAQKEKTLGFEINHIFTLKVKNPSELSFFVENIFKYKQNVCHLPQEFLNQSETVSN